MNLQVKNFDSLYSLLSNIFDQRSKKVDELRVNKYDKNQNSKIKRYFKDLELYIKIIDLLYDNYNESKEERYIQENHILKKQKLFLIALNQ